MVAQFNSTNDSSFKWEYVYKKTYSKSNRPVVSVILLDWKCRESFHILEYLQNQNVERDKYEIIWIEYYDNKPETLKKLVLKSQNNAEPILDQWIVLNLPDKVYYHKHFMYNIGILASNGEIVVIMDSDAFIEPTFIATIIDFFAQEPQAVLHMDEVRNGNPKYYPFSYPSIDDIKGPGTLNWRNNITAGLLDKVEFLHTRNYGACMCAKREHLIAIGGADEHLDYLGHICGPYDMTFRLKNYGLKVVWHELEYLYHAWHPGTDGVDNYLGPHCGRNLSVTSLAALYTNRVFPFLENPAIHLLRSGKTTELSFDLLRSIVADETRLKNWQMEPKKQALSLARENWHSGRRVKSLALWEYIIRAWPEDTLLLEEGIQILRRRRLIEKALILADKVLQRDKTSLIAKIEKAYVLSAKGQKAEASELFQQAIDTLTPNVGEDPRYYQALRDAWQGLAWCLYDLGNFTDSMDAFQQARHRTRYDEIKIHADLAKGLALAAEKASVFLDERYNYVMQGDVEIDVSAILANRRANVLSKNISENKIRKVIKKIIFWEILKPLLRRHLREGSIIGRLFRYFTPNFILVKVFRHI